MKEKINETNLKYTSSEIAYHKNMGKGGKECELLGK